MESNRERCLGCLYSMCWKHLFWKQLKTTSEWPQSGPVIPLSSFEISCLHRIAYADDRAEQLVSHKSQCKQMLYKEMNPGGTTVLLFIVPGIAKAMLGIFVFMQKKIEEGYEANKFARSIRTRFDEHRERENLFSSFCIKG